MIQQLEVLRAAAGRDIAEAQSLEELREIRVRYLGKKGELTRILKGLGALTPEERPIAGQRANTAREEIEGLLDAVEADIGRLEKERRYREEAVDLTLPGVPIRRGAKHPIQRVREEIERIFIGMGYEIAHGPEIETDYFNFEALNLPKGHPSRDMQDTFFVTEDILLRTHTSPVQIRYMQAHAPKLPVKIIVPGRVYRVDDDATHSPMFHQVEGLVVDKGITFGDLAGTLTAFAQAMYAAEARIRLRPSYFPFTEPSAEVDVSCVFCKGDGCRVCKGSGWLEILGSGSVHPVVLRNGGYDPEEVSGFAFGMGIERITMLKYGIDDMRLLYQNDLRFLRQF